MLDQLKNRFKNLAGADKTLLLVAAVILFAPQWLIYTVAAAVFLYFGYVLTKDMF